ncbi:monooxygenase [Paracoccus sp. S-4012]|uniref:monooxygenase n=1 Tax=Paracoccus sp. S-4012 TaxID=2665648 RepID=UPI0012B064BA|nr:monooxygenase [Paracoccus sp. S-4012]MRX49973.1 monooxygenase [Paracoccus sp. S-4012]
MILLQFDFPMTGPWGAEMAEAFRDLAEDIAAEPGLVWKIWTEAPDENRGGGLYLFETRPQAEAYREKHAARLAGMGVEGIRALIFEINRPLSQITRAPL